ncbi:MazG-like nucleotide pyrophosphohydrolase family protein [Alteromonadaceae bacterium 2753L.S.0a.02]|nr:MazG-like nucleotide pyrophosphohydrolase family protein [Alteromonadaceae bacterium 2753L.S.0a.02]
MNKDLILNEFSRVSQAMGWDSRHSPKNLANAVSIEAAKLLENFQWLSDIDSELLREDGDINKVAADIADIFIYLVVMCHKLDLDPWVIVKDKLLVNRTKFIEQIVAREISQQMDNFRSDAPTQGTHPQPASQQTRYNTPSPVSEVASKFSASSNESIDWVAVAKKIANSRAELKEQSNRLRADKSKDDTHS